ncbi:MAG TPA: alpha/beta fold hydrolase [Steroidobacteraceae bacterium]|nr:alpha/beta fold hydrolase [Steroidobacteraceae bacterium]
MTARTFVMVSGAWHGAWCWNRLVPLLEARGHRVHTPELPGTGSSHADPATASLDGWARFIAELVSAQPAPVVLVGHSRGGAVISRAAQMAPWNLRMLVYLAAYLLPAGANVAAAARDDDGSLVPENMVAAGSGVTCTLRPDIIREAFYGDCDDQAFEFARTRLTPEPLKPLVSNVKTSAEVFGKVPRTYIECTRDRTISLTAQRRMQAALPCDPVFTLESDHSPFLSHPDELATLLARL